MSWVSSMDYKLNRLSRLNKLNRLNGLNRLDRLNGSNEPILTLVARCDHARFLFMFSLTVSAAIPAQYLVMISGTLTYLANCQTTRLKKSVLWHRKDSYASVMTMWQARKSTMKFSRSDLGFLGRAIDLRWEGWCFTTYVRCIGSYIWYFQLCRSLDKTRD